VPSIAIEISIGALMGSGLPVLLPLAVAGARGFRLQLPYSDTAGDPSQYVGEARLDLRNATPRWTQLWTQTRQPRHQRISTLPRSTAQPSKSLV